MGLVAPAAIGMTEVETLRQLCAKQEKQIRLLKEENIKLREGPIEPLPEPTPAADKPVKSTSVAAPVPAPIPVVDKPVQSESEPMPELTPVAEPEVSEPPPVAAPVPKVASPPPLDAAADGKTYTVLAKDSFDKIARKNGCTAEALAQANGLAITAIIHPGQKLKLPEKSASHVNSKPGAAAAKTPPVVTPEKATGPELPAKLADTDESAKPLVPESAPATKKSAVPAPPEPAPSTKSDKKTHTVKIETETTYGEFAAKYGTNTKRLNDLNGLDLQKSTVLAKGSELYVPGQP